MTMHARGPASGSADVFGPIATSRKSAKRWRITPALSLAAACCIWPPSERRTAAIRGAAARALDWDQFLQVVKRQRVAGLVHDGLTRAAVTAPPRIGSAIAAMAFRDARQNLSLAAESLRLQRIFEKADIPILFVKGATLAKLVYGNLGIRHSKDIDFLIPPDNVAFAFALLDEAGYKRIEPPAQLSERQFWRWFPIGKECEFVHSETGVQIELHWRLMSNPLLLVGDIGQNQQTVPISGDDGLRTLSNDDLFPYLCAHGASAAWVRLKWLADIGAMLEQQNPADIELLYQSAESRGVGRCAAQAMLLCERLFKTPVPKDLLDRFRKYRTLRWLEAIGFAAMAGGDASQETDDRPFGTTRISLSQYLLQRGWRYWLTEFRNQFTNVEDMMLLRLPRPLTFLYPWLRMPLWLSRRVRIWSRQNPNRVNNVGVGY